MNKPPGNVPGGLFMIDILASRSFTGTHDYRLAGSMGMDRKGNRAIDRACQDLLGFEALF